jgi:uncharacterized protein YndB with AHSA1/START domain
MSDETRPTGEVSTTSDASGLEIVRILDASRAAVFEAWTEPEHFAAWFGEHGSSVPVDRASMDVRAGGAWRAVMLVGPEETELVFSGHYREVERQARLVFTVTDVVDGDDADAVLVTVDLEELGDGRTRMVVTQRGGHMPADEYERAMQGWRNFLERQAEHLKPRHDGDS